MQNQNDRVTCPENAPSNLHRTKWMFMRWSAFLVELQCTYYGLYVLCQLMRPQVGPDYVSHVPSYGMNTTTPVSPRQPTRLTITNAVEINRRE